MVTSEHEGIVDGSPLHRHPRIIGTILAVVGVVFLYVGFGRAALLAAEGAESVWYSGKLGGLGLCFLFFGAPAVVLGRLFTGLFEPPPGTPAGSVRLTPQLVIAMVLLGGTMVGATIMLEDYLASLGYH